MSWNERLEPWTAQAEDARDAGDVDYARVIHSASFRRLQGKTQILNLGDSDFYRTRLTHSLEVAQIAGGIAKQLAKSFPDHVATKYLPDRSLIQAIGCAHDLGHPPFGHGGEAALNYCMRDSNPKVAGFEGNGQTLRILTRLENFSRMNGANLTRRTLLGTLKYPVPYSRAYNSALAPQLLSEATTLQILDAETSKPPKCYMDSEGDIVEWILNPLSDKDRNEFQAFDLIEDKHNKPRHKSIDASIMDTADDIAYGVHDLEDAIALKLVTEERFRDIVNETAASSFLDAMKDKYPDESENNVYDQIVSSLFGSRASRKHTISRIVHHLITAIEFFSLDELDNPIIKHRTRIKSQPRIFLDALQELVYTDVIKSPGVQQLEFKGQQMVVAVFEAMQSSPDRLLPTDALAKYRASKENKRTICDYVSGMTDTYLMKTYERLFSPRIGSIFDKL
jgi:dGTPase